MDGFDFSPLFRSTIGFDRLMRLADTATRVDAGVLSALQHRSHRRERLSPDHGGGRLRAEDLDITVKENELLVSGRQDRGRARQYLFRGLARRAFERRFQLADHIKVTGAKLRERPPACRPRARDSRGDEAAQDRDRRRRQRSADAPAKGGLTPGSSADGGTHGCRRPRFRGRRRRGGAAREGRLLQGARLESAGSTRVRWGGAPRRRRSIAGRG